MIATKTEFNFSILLSFVPIFYLFFFCVGISLILSCAAVFFRDLAHLYSIVLTALNFLTPIFYPIDILPEKVRYLVELNPLTQAIQMLRGLILYNQTPTWSQHVMMGSVTLVTLIVGLFVFYKKQDRFILYI